MHKSEDATCSLLLFVVVFFPFTPFLISKLMTEVETGRFVGGPVVSQITTDPVDVERRSAFCCGHRLKHTEKIINKTIVLPASQCLELNAKVHLQAQYFSILNVLI